MTDRDRSLFMGRRDIVRLVDQDIAAERPVPLVLLGQRRMGKSTLLNFLPDLLGTGTEVVTLNFQALSGQEHRGAPHLWVAEAVAKRLGRRRIKAPSPPASGTWGAVFDWLQKVERRLEEADLRLLITLDEVEALQRGIEEGWSDAAFLDFLRAAGDRLHRIRFLLVTAHPFSRLGPQWSDRLISAQTRRLGVLDEGAARDLLTRPIPDFPDIYPPGGVDKLVEETGRHPYLLQLVAYHLTRRLNSAERLEATGDHLDAALDDALDENQLFQNLWDDFEPAERRLMAGLAEGMPFWRLREGSDDDALDKARRDLARELFIAKDGDDWKIAVPLFARWIREIALDVDEAVN